MIRALHLSDLPRCLLMAREAARNRARPRDSLGGSAPVWVDLTIESVRRVSGSPDSVAIAWFDGGRIACLGVASQLAGPASWEIARLHVGPGAEGAVAEVAMALYAEAVRRSASRMSARVPEDDPIGPELSRAGLLPSHAEALHRGTGRGPSREPEAAARAAGPADEHGLFRLHSACVPPEVRALGGMTLEQWRSARWEGAPGRPGADQRILESDGRAVAWVGVARTAGSAEISMLVHPDHPDSAAGMLSLGLSMVPEGSPVAMLIPDYLASVGRAATGAGLAPSERFEVHARSARATERIFQEMGAYEVA